MLFYDIFVCFSVYITYFRSVAVICSFFFCLLKFLVCFPIVFVSFVESVCSLLPVNVFHLFLFNCQRFSCIFSLFLNVFLLFLKYF